VNTKTSSKARNDGLNVLHESETNDHGGTPINPTSAIESEFTNTMIMRPIKLLTAALVLAVCLSARLSASEPYEGYTFFSMGKTAYLYDMNKEKVHEWEVAGGSIQTSPYLLPDGSVLFPLNKGGFTFKPGGAHPSGTFQRISPEGEVLWDFKFFGEDFTPSYDIEPMPNGNVLVCAGYQDGGKPGKIFEIKPVGKNGGEVVWECNVTELLGGNVRGYINSISYNAAADQVFVNIQTPGTTLAVIDHSKPVAELVFKWDEGFSGRLHGGSWVTDNYVGTDIKTPDSDAKKMRVGNILTVSNGDNEVVEVDPRTNQRVKTIKHEFSDHQGSAQRLPNGNTLIVSGYSNRIDEVDDDGNVVWSMETPEKISRALRYGSDYTGVTILKKP